MYISQFGIWTWLLAPVTASGLELDSYYRIPKFEVRISTELKEPSQPMFINGTKYQCHVPTQEEWLISELPNKPTEAQILEATNVINGLTNCTQIVDGYWGYSLCYNKEILQVKTEMEKDMYIFPPDSPRFLLGSISKEPPTVEFRNGKWQLKVQYVNGDTCDLTGEPRKTNLFYYCNEAVTKETLDSFRETHICQYEFSVATNKLCRAFKPSPPRINFIDCYSETLTESLEKEVEQLLGDNLDARDRVDPELEIEAHVRHGIKATDSESAEKEQDFTNGKGEQEVLVDPQDVSAPGAQDLPVSSSETNPANNGRDTEVKHDDL